MQQDDRQRKNGGNLPREDLFEIWNTYEDHLRSGTAVRFKNVPRIMPDTGDQVGNEYCLSSPDRWPNRTNESVNQGVPENLLHGGPPSVGKQTG